MGIQTDLIKLMGIYHCLCPKIIIMWSCSARHEMLRALFEVCGLVHRAVCCISNQYNTTAKNWRSSSSPSSCHNLQGFRPCDLFWFHQQSRRLLRCHSWLHFSSGWYFTIQCGSLSVCLCPFGKHVVPNYFFDFQFSLKLG